MMLILVCYGLSLQVLLLVHAVVICEVRQTLAYLLYISVIVASVQC
jgi:hypothetical protein